MPVVVNNQTVEFERLFSPVRRQAYNMAYDWVRNSTAAEDIVQDACVKALAAFSRYDQNRPFVNWFMRIVRNIAIDHTRRHRLVLLSLDQMTDMDGENPFTLDISDTASDPETVVLSAVLDERLELALNSLPDEYRRVIMLRDLEGMSYEEIAERTRAPVGTIRSRLHRGRVQLRRHHLLNSRSL